MIMGVDLRPYGKLPALAVWCFFGTCFYSFIAYQMFGERGKRNRVSFLLISLSFSSTVSKLTTDHDAFFHALNDSLEKLP